MVVTTVAAGALAAVPAILGVVGNPSFRQQLPVRVPSQVAHLSDVGAQVSRTSHAPTPRPTRSATRSATRMRGAENRGTDDRRSGRASEPGGDRHGGESGGGRRSGSDDDGRGGSSRGDHGGGSDG